MNVTIAGVLHAMHETTYFVAKPLSHFYHCFHGRSRRTLFDYKSPPTQTPSSAPSWKKQAFR